MSRGDRYASATAAALFTTCTLEGAAQFVRHPRYPCQGLVAHRRCALKWMPDVAVGGHCHLQCSHNSWVSITLHTLALSLTNSMSSAFILNQIQ
jgi:hypothetical protein